MIQIATTLAVALLSPMLSGKFFQGNGTGCNQYLVFHGSDQVKFEFHGCFSKSQAEGRYSIKGDQLTLRLPHNDQTAGVASSYRIIRWGSRSFLVANDEIAYFVFRRQHGWKGEGSDFFSDNLKGVGLETKPQVPSDWQVWIDGRRRKFRVSTICVEHRAPLMDGTESGIFPGTILVAADKTLFQISEAQRDQAIIDPIFGREAKEGDLLVPSEAPFGLRGSLDAIKKARRNASSPKHLRS